MDVVVLGARVNLLQMSGERRCGTRYRIELGSGPDSKNVGAIAHRSSSGGMSRKLFIIHSPRGTIEPQHTHVNR